MPCECRTSNGGKVYVCEKCKISKINTSTIMSGYKELIAKYDEYLSFLNDAMVDPLWKAHASGWRCPQKLIKKGEKFRAEIEQIKMAL